MDSFADIVRRIGTACEATDALWSFCGETVRLCVSSSHHSDRISARSARRFKCDGRGHSEQR